MGEQYSARALGTSRFLDVNVGVDVFTHTGIVLCRLLSRPTRADVEYFDSGQVWKRNGVIADSAKTEPFVLLPAQDVAGDVVRYDMPCGKVVYTPYMQSHKLFAASQKGPCAYVSWCQDCASESGCKRLQAAGGGVGTA